MVLRAFEQITGLRTGTLEADPTIQNRSMTVPEIETIRHFNIAFKEKNLPSLLYMRIMRFGATFVMQQRTPQPDEPKIELPDWSVEPIREIATEMMDNIRATGVRVVGDLDDLLVVPPPRVGPAPEVKVSPEVAASAALGVLIASGLARGTAELTVDDDVEATDDVSRRNRALGRPRAAGPAARSSSQQMARGDACGRARVDVHEPDPRRCARMPRPLGPRQRGARSAARICATASGTGVRRRVDDEVRVLGLLVRRVDAGEVAESRRRATCL